MAIQQISIFVENKPAALVSKVQALSSAGINLRAMCIADTKEFGILRVIVSDTEKAREVLSADSIATVTEVVAVKMNDQAGALCDILKVLADAGINVEYMYAFTATADKFAYVVIRVDNNDEAEKALTSAGIAVLDTDELSRM